MSCIDVLLYVVLYFEVYNIVYVAMEAIVLLLMEFSNYPLFCGEDGKRMPSSSWRIYINM